jgi:hypothetical protein
MSAVENATQAIHAHNQMLLEQLEPLRIEKQRFIDELATIEKLIAEIESRLKREGHTEKKGNRKPRKQSKPCAKKADVLAATRELVSDHQPIELGQLEAKLKQELSVERGFSLSGVALRLRECLSTTQFSSDPDGNICFASKGVPADELAYEPGAEKLPVDDSDIGSIDA